MSDAAPPALSLPPRGRAALLLDVDGTLLDIAPRPDAVIVPPGLLDSLRRLRATEADAVAVVSGRPVEQIEGLLGDAPYAIAGEHGTAFRYAPHATIERPDLPRPPQAWIEEARRLADEHEGVLFEPKEYGFVLHYRLAPALGGMLQKALLTLLRGSGVFVLMPARKAWEVKPSGADKGVAVERLMKRPPFLGRLPIFIGDDVTDEDGMAAARALGGAGLRVPDVFGDAAGVRAWLGRAAETEKEWPGF